ncbi:MAG TPA: RNA polymerase sigma factor [Saprospiraceae bacterium]|nr:RNA polymerase sigma factor [Saprospiraceae bacterium]
MNVHIFENSIDTNQHYLRMFALKLTKNSEEAADLFQETVYRAIKNKDKFVPGSNIKAWLTTIMKNSFINNYRRKKKIQTSPNGDVHDFIIENNSTAAKNQGENDMMMQELGLMIDQLDNDLKEPFIMMWQGYKYDEVAEHLNIPLGTVKSRIFQARKILQARVRGLFNISYKEEMIA